jgi:antitoxin CptB
MAESVDTRRKRLLYRCRNRGMLETSLLLRAFADRYLEGLDAAELDAFEALLEANDNQIYAWILGQETPPEGQDRRLIALIRDYKNAR